mgnify:CR=1 FL=1
MADLQGIVDEIYEALVPRLGEGRVADYIPQLAHVDPRKLGLAVVDVDGSVYKAGDCDEAFSIQSVSKVFTLTLALGKHGENVWRRVGREPSGSSFNSIVQLENEEGKPRNPFINAGAIAISDLVLAGHTPREAIGYRNIALANFMRSFGRLDHPVDHVVGVYFHHCALAMTCAQLAHAGLFLAAAGRNPLTGHTVVSRERARRINALMLTCGHYDGSGDFAYRVGLPGKSGVGGGILAVAPGKASVAVWSPGLNHNGNSLLGSLALEMLAHRTGWSVFGP